jgi:hypothetical protein
MNEPEHTKGRFAAFWTSMPGILTGVAGLIAAIAGLLALFVVPGDSGDSGSSRADWADKVDPICSQAINSVRQIPISATADVNETASYLHQVATIARGMSEKVRAVPAPTEDQSSIDRMTALWDQQADEMDSAALDLQSGDQAGFSNAQQQLDAAQTEGDALATSLGVTACAQKPVPTVAP